MELVLGRFGNRCLEKRGFFLDRLLELGGSRAWELRLTRLLRNAAVSVEEMMAEAAQRTAERSHARNVLVIQDTTAVRSEGRGGNYLHAVLAVDSLDGSILELIDGQFLQRTAGWRDA